MDAGRLVVTCMKVAKTGSDLHGQQQADGYLHDN